MPDGHPDLQGTYDLATMTPIERTARRSAGADARNRPKSSRRRSWLAGPTDATKLDPNRGTLPVGGDHSSGKTFFEILEKAGGGAVGGYDRLWLNQGTAYTVVDGQIRTSIVIDPPNGRVPPFNAAAHRRGVRADAADVRPRIRARARMSGRYRAAASTTIRNSARSASAACSDSVPPPVRRRCRIISTTICIRSCRPGLGHDPDRDGPRRAHRAHERAASSQDHPPLDGRFGGPLGRRHAGGRHHQFHRQDPVPRIDARISTWWSASRASTRRRCCIASRWTIRQTWDQPWTGEYDLAGDRPARSTNTPATRATTRWAMYCAAPAGRKPRKRLSPASKARGQPAVNKSV